MRYTLSLAALVAMSSSVLAQKADFNPVWKPTSLQNLAVGSEFRIEWGAPAQYAGADDTISIELIGGESQDKQTPVNPDATGKAIPFATKVQNSLNATTWKVDPGNGPLRKFYGFILRLEKSPKDVFQYSNPFHIVAKEPSVKGAAGSPSKPVQTLIVSSLSSTPAATVPTSAAATTTMGPSRKAQVTDVSDAAAANRAGNPDCGGKNVTASSQAGGQAGGSAGGSAGSARPVSSSNTSSATAGGKSGASGSNVSGPTTNAAAALNAGFVVLFGGLVAAMVL